MLYIREKNKKIVCDTNEKIIVHNKAIKGQERMVQRFKAYCANVVKYFELIHSSTTASKDGSTQQPGKTY